MPVRFRDEVRPGDALGAVLLDEMKRARIRPLRGDILVIKHKIVSKAEGQLVDLQSIRPAASSRAWGKRFKVDARVIQLALTESKRVVRRKRGVLITETRHGLICANSGVDVSNVNGGRHALLLPRDPDLSARKLHRELKKQLGLVIPVIISDSFGRPWREGLTEVAIADARGARTPSREHRANSVEFEAGTEGERCLLLLGLHASSPTACSSSRTG